MWSVDNKTAYSAAGSWIRDGHGAEVWIIAIKASYDLQADGSLRIAAQQVPVHTAPLLHEGLDSLLSETDLGPPQAATDVLLVGHAHAPEGRPVTELDVAWRVGPIRRSARVFGDRYWKPGLLGASATRPEPFVRMPLIWERAFAHETHNPVGCGIEPDTQGPLKGHVRLPNVESIEHPVTSPGSRPEPVGFGPVASHWQPRRRHAGTFDRAWQQVRSPLQPEDLDARHWQCAPPEQQVAGHLKGAEPVALVNLTPAGFATAGRIGFTLPRITLAFETRFSDGSVEHSRSVIHSVTLNTDIPRVSVVHHMHLPCHAKVNLLERTIVREKSRPLDRVGDPATALVEASFARGRST